MSASLERGSLFAKDFEIVEPLGAGGMGAVYVARQKSTGKLRALKLMLEPLVESADLRRRFEQEARVAALIDSDHVVEVVGAGVDDATGLPWLAMELLEGTDLDTAVAQRGPMTLSETRHVLRELCHAVGAAHAAGIVHRDLKPQNVFLARSSHAQHGRTVKVLDFGIARVVADARTRHTAAIGSPLWMAPEQTERGVVTEAADVWAIGLIAFFLLTGKRFWLAATRPDGSVQQVMREVIFEPIPAASDRARELGASTALPSWFDAWLARCLERDPAARVANASSAIALFETLCDAPESAPELLAVPGSRAPDVACDPTIPLAGGSARTLPIVTPTPTPTPRRRADDVSAEPPRRGRIGVLLACLAVVVAALVTVLRLDGWPAAPTSLLPPPGPPSFDLPPELARTAGAGWFARIRGRCNPLESALVIQHDPPPPGRDGAGFAAACFALAGRIPLARARIDALPPGDRAWASWAVFEVVHPIADQGDDPAAGPAMRLVLAYWPDNYMALYHAGMSAYRAGDRAEARDDLERFASIYKKQDGFTSSASRVLAELDAPSAGAAAPDCATPITTDPEGHPIYHAGCPRRSR